MFAPGCDKACAAGYLGSCLRRVVIKLALQDTLDSYSLVASLSDTIVALETLRADRLSNMDFVVQASLGDIRVRLPGTPWAHMFPSLWQHHCSMTRSNHCHRFWLPHRRRRR